MRPTLAVLLLSLASACDDGTATTVTTTTPPPKTVPATLDATGSYRLTSPIDVPPTVLASQTIVDYLALLRLLRNDPATAFVQVLDEAGVPMASDLFAVLPGVLKSQLKDAINDYVGSLAKGDSGAGGAIDRILALSETAFARFTLESHLTVPPNATLGPMAGTHVVQGVVLEVPGGSPITIPRDILTKLAALPGALDATPTVAVSAAKPGQGDAAVAIGDHAFGLAYGEILFTALDGYGTGVSLRSRLAGAFDCAGMGQSVANRCVLGVCIGHAADIRQMCESALDLAVDKLHDQLAGMSFQAVRFAKGSGQLWDCASVEPKDGVVSRMDQGLWQASIDVGTGPRDTKASFTGQRL